jgi:hypothetical protein
MCVCVYCFGILFLIFVANASCACKSSCVLVYHEFYGDALTMTNFAVVFQCFDLDVC